LTAAKNPRPTTAHPRQLEFPVSPRQPFSFRTLQREWGPSNFLSARTAEEFSTSFSFQNFFSPPLPFPSSYFRPVKIGMPLNQIVFLLLEKPFFAVCEKFSFAYDGPRRAFPPYFPGIGLTLSVPFPLEPVPQNITPIGVAGLSARPFRSHFLSPAFQADRSPCVYVFHQTLIL